MSWSRPPQPTRDEKIAARQAPRPAPTLRPLSVGVYGGTTGAPVPKHDYVRSPALMKAYRLIPCQNCGKDDGTVCGAHANWSEFGKGMAIKADDNRAASLCSTCHSMLDQGSILGASERLAMWWTAHCKTVRELLKRGLWPKAVPVPSLEWGRAA